MLIFGVIVAVVAFGVSALGTFLVLGNARRMQLMQEPNERSSHTQPTPSGGGLGFVIAGSLAAFFTIGVLNAPVLIAILLSLLMAGIGFADDRAPLSARFRLGVQLVLLLALLLSAAPWGWLVALLLLIPLVYWVNLFNFMDGIDGLAASQALFILSAAALLIALGNPGAMEAPLFWWMIASAAAVAAFLLFNWPPARIFMGDAGSTYLAFMLAFFALVSMGAGWLTPAQVLILPAAFIVDASVTLARRLLRGENIIEAHRRHAYQVQARRLKSHRVVTLIYAGINVIWLLPLAALAGGSFGWLFVIAAYLPLTIAAYLAGAGQAPD